MKLSLQIATHFRNIHFGCNWTCVNLRDTLLDVTWQQATTKVDGFNSIATLVFHTNYYADEVMKVLQGGPLNAKDALSFVCPPITNAYNWQALLDKVWMDATAFANLVEKLPESRLWEIFSEEKLGNYYRNLHGIIEHIHYHLGQIVLLKKILLQQGT